MKRFDLWSGIFLLALSVFVCLESLGFGFGSFAAPGPGFLSFWAGSLLACFSLALIIGDIRTRPSNGENVFEKVRWRGWMVTFAGLAGYTLLLEVMGFIVCTFLLIALLLTFIEPQRWTVVFLMATLTTAGSYLLFQIILKTQLPPGILGF